MVIKIFTRFLRVPNTKIKATSRFFYDVALMRSHNWCCNYYELGRNSVNYPSSTEMRFHSKVNAMAALSPMDPSSFSLPDLAVMKHASLQLDVDFERKILTSSALLSFDVKKNIDEIVLDFRDLTILSIETLDGRPLNFTIGDAVPDFGSKLTITLTEAVKAEQEIKIKIKYVTSPKASALQWLEPSQTSGKVYPYLFSQCQPIHARSILPCQDSPAVKFTYDAEVTAPKEFTVLMSALRCESNGNTTKFMQPVPIPSYLLAIAVGVLQSRRLGPRSLVWSEENEIEQSAWEFAETEKYLQAAEALCGPYEWSQYDLLVLPPSFPYGGMENPCLTFVTPTLLAGDRSQADVIVHEIMHSWTGNLVTNKTFEHFWLNEGFTVFLERKVAASLITDKVEARKSRDFHSLLGLKELKDTIQTFLGEDNALTQLQVNLKGIHPDDAFSRVPYEKGSLLLRFLEDLVGGPEVFDEFLRAYLTHFKKKSLDTDEFKAFLLDYFSDNEKIQQVQFETWFNTSGMPPVIPNYDTSMTKAISELLPELRQDRVSDSTIEAASSFTPHQMIHFLQEMLDLPPLSLESLRTLGAALKLPSSKNSEILYRWLRLCIKSKDTASVPEALEFLNKQGRMKYVRPIYRDLYAWEEMRDRAIKNFLKNEPYLMHVSAYTLRKDLHLRDNEKVAA